MNLLSFVHRNDILIRPYFFAVPYEIYAVFLYEFYTALFPYEFSVFYTNFYTAFDTNFFVYFLLSLQQIDSHTLYIVMHLYTNFSLLFETIKIGQTILLL